jgi:hypothetical protein
MRRKISNAPAPIRPLPNSVGSPASQLEPKPEPKSRAKATSPSAILAFHRFWRAASDCEQAIEMAYDPTIDGTRWASVRRQWLVWRHDAELRAQLCKTERLPELRLTEVLNKLHSLDHLWKIACDYRTARERVNAKREAIETPTTQKHSHGYKTDLIIERMRTFIKGGGTLEQLENMLPKKVIDTLYDKDKPDVSRNTVLKAINELKTCEYCQMTSNDK